MNRQEGLSPRGRGKQLPAGQESRKPGSIPAWAGETRWRGWSRWLYRVYPRVGGGNPDPGRPKMTNRGLSPRGRGKQSITPGSDLGTGSIPAWAGETTAAVC